MIGYFIDMKYIIAHSIKSVLKFTYMDCHSYLKKYHLKCMSCPQLH